ncbi:uncharacterized protein LOC122671215 [Telopea speciosissima]|uniref:uncharacterized protein LOC122671215 n=1 Tax=Telopea speciosissima TaxID=54955 RepID=UPI001CC6B833|nr:uncharacterized protein LOC122671215 [Telopea speciosissima]
MYPVPPRTTRGCDIMEGGSSFKEVGTSSTPEGQSNRKMSEMDTLRQMYKEKSSKIQELKAEIELVKHQLEKDSPDECVKGFKALSEKYEKLRTEYNALLPKKGDPGI